MPEVLDLCTIWGGNALAEALSYRYDSMYNAARKWRDEKAEVRRYLFATDSRYTSDAEHTWHNSTTVPKLCQIRDNLHAYYRATMFSNPDWIEWQGADDESVDEDVVKGLRAYMKTKIKDSLFEEEVDKLIYDYLDYGNCFAEVRYQRHLVDNEDGTQTVKYVGGKLHRIDPESLVFDVTASSFASSPKFVRELHNIGDLYRIAELYPDRAFYKDIADKARENRERHTLMSDAETKRSADLRIQGFGDYNDYLQSGSVEVLRFEGDFYSSEAGFVANKRIYIVDRLHVVHEEEMDDWLAGSRIRHAGWRKRPNNLMAMSPFDNIVGMQYRMDHLQNMKSDVLELTVAPPIKVRGMVEDFEWQPLERIYVGDDGDVDLLSPNVGALNVNIEIDWLEAKMESMAGAPREAMGIRSAGEKTAYEVQSLENASSRIFQDRVRTFEQEFIEPLVNDMLEQGRRNSDIVEIVRDVDPTLGAQVFEKITPDMLQVSGKLYSVASRHFAQKAQAVQTLNSLAASGLYADPAVMNHISGLKLAQVLGDSLDRVGDGLVQENIRILEQASSQEMAMVAEQDVMNVAATAGIDEGFEEALPPEMVEPQG